MRLLEKLTRKGTHCAVEWSEPDSPRSVVPVKSVSGLSGEDFEVGDVCKVSVREGSKTVTYEATVLGIGENIDIKEHINNNNNSILIMNMLIFR